MTDDFFSGVDKAAEALELEAAGDDLLRLSHELVSALDLEQALSAAGEAVRSVCDAERFVVLLRDENGTLQPRAAKNSAGQSLPLPQSVLLEACRTADADNEIIHAYVPAKDERWARSPGAGELLGFCAVPMQSPQGARGVIYVDGQSRFVRQLDTSTRETLALLAGHAAIAVHNAELLQKVRADPSSRLPSRAYFERRLFDELRRSLRYQRPFSILYVDIDGAEQLLNRYDLGALDELVTGVGQVMVEVCRDTDLVARVGPARLGILVPEPPDGLGDIGALRGLAERVREHLQSAALQVRGVPQKLRLFFGGVSYQQAPLLGIKGVLHEADLAIDVARRERGDHFLTR